jgi:uncharacterized protein YlxW (UPF0749 family)
MASAIPGDVTHLLLLSMLAGAAGLTALLAALSFFFAPRKVRLLLSGLLATELLIGLGGYLAGAWPRDTATAERAIDRPAQAQLETLRADLATLQTTKAATEARAAELRESLNTTQAETRAGETAIAELKTEWDRVIRESVQTQSKIDEINRFLSTPLGAGNR